MPETAGSERFTAEGGSSNAVGGCPAPLAWREVVDAFYTNRQRRESTVDGRAVAVSTLGEGPPLYLLNGFFGDAAMFAMLVWLLQEEQTCVVCDWWDTSFIPNEDGVSPVRTVFSHSATEAERHLLGLAQAVLRAADDLGHDRFALHGTSFGSLVGLQMMLEAPERIERASLQDGSAARRLSVTEKVLLRFARPSRKSLGELRFVSAIQRQNHRSWFPPFDGTRWDFYEQQMGRTPVREVARLAAIAGQVDLRPRLDEINTPLLVIPCEGDGAVSTLAQQELARRLGNSTVEYLDNCGSLPHLTHPHRLAKLLRTFRDNGGNVDETG